MLIWNVFICVVLCAWRVSCDWRRNHWGSFLDSSVPDRQLGLIIQQEDMDQSCWVLESWHTISCMLYVFVLRIPEIWIYLISWVLICCDGRKFFSKVRKSFLHLTIMMGGRCRTIAMHRMSLMKVQSRFKECLDSWNVSW